MKTKTTHIKLFGLIAISVIIGFGLIGCDDPIGSEPTSELLGITALL